MSKVICKEFLGLRTEWYCSSLDHAVVGLFGLLALSLMFVWFKWHRSQCRKMQRIRGAQRNGPAVLVKDGKQERWEYSRYLPWKGKIFIAPRHGYDLEDANADLESLSDALRLRGSARPVAVEHNENWLRFLGFRFVARPDLTRLSPKRKAAPAAGRSLEFQLGTDQKGAPVSLSFGAGAAGAIVGGSGCGKSVLLERIISQARKELNFEVTLIDPHEMVNDESLDGVRVIGPSLESWLEHYRALDFELDQRLRTLRERRVTKWTELPHEVIPAKLTCVDECHELLDPHLASNSQRATPEQKQFAELQSLIQKLAGQGRKAGLLQVFVGQSAYSGDWSLSFTNMTLFKAAFALPNEALSTSFLGTPVAADSALREGRFVFSDSKGTRVVKIAPDQKRKSLTK